MSLPAFGDFNGLNLPKWDREMIESGFKAVSSVEGGWDFLKSYSPPKGEGFMFSASVGKRKEIDDAIDREYGGHSGGSYGQTMRILEFIAKQGWEAYAKKMLDEYGPPGKKTETMEEKRQRFLALPTNMSLEDQVKALVEFNDVPMSYSEMRERFG